LGSASEEDDASKRTEWFATGAEGANVNRAVGPAPVTPTRIEVAWDNVPLVPVTTTVYDPGAVAFSMQVDTCVPLMLDGKHEAVTPAGEEAGVSATVPVNPSEG